MRAIVRDDLDFLDPVFLFWTRRDRWPKEADYVFLGEAVLAFGARMFGTWHDTDPVAHLTLWEETRDSGALATEVGRVRWQEKEFRKLIEPAAATMLMSPAGRAASHAHFVEVQRKIAELAAAGVLKTFVRPVPGAVPVTEAPADWWHIENQYLAAWFALCRLYRDEPASGKVAINDRYASYIFISEQSLKAGLARILRVAAPSEELDSPERRRGKPGQKSLKKHDRPLLDEMKRRIEDGRAQSPEDAARQVAPKAIGRGSIESRAERLARRFREINPSE
jgi:hypothetical protein